MPSPKILIVDDEHSIIESLTGILEDEGYAITAAHDAEEALSALSQHLPDLILLDIWMPGMDGIDLLKRIKEEWPFIPVVVMSGHGTIETAVRATRLGAHDFLEKPLSYEQVILAIRNAIKYRDLEEENLLLRQKTKEGQEIIGESDVMKHLKEQIAIVAPTDAWVLIQGENGTGKELVARMVYRLSRRKDKPFVEINCAAIPEELIESELFGHEKGAFTGATSMKRGKFDLANGGTLFLDEIGDMSLKTQAKILRILQEQRFERVGGGKTITVDVRIIAATNKDLEKEIEKGCFREDLYYRLNVIPIEVPPLRERKDDIPLLFSAFVREFTGNAHRRPPRIDEAIYTDLMNYDWPGNIRELRNLAERLVILSRGKEITAVDLPSSIRKARMDSGSLNGHGPSAPDTSPDWLSAEDYRTAKAGFERAYLSRKLAENDRNIKKTAEAIGIERRHLYRKLHALGLDA